MDKAASTGHPALFVRAAGSVPQAKWTERFTIFENHCQPLRLSLVVFHGKFIEQLRQETWFTF